MWQEGQPRGWPFLHLYSHTGRCLTQRMEMELVMEMEVSFNVSEHELEAVRKPLRAYNLSHTGAMGFETVGILLRDPITQEVVGGLYGKIY